MPDNWWEDREILFTVAYWLCDQHVFDHSDEVVYFFEKPWKWQEEYEDWCELQEHAGNPS